MFDFIFVVSATTALISQPHYHIIRKIIIRTAFSELLTSKFIVLVNISYTIRKYSGHRRIPDVIFIEVQAAFDKSRRG
jgi:hypothetical protein